MIMLNSAFWLLVGVTVIASAAAGLRLALSGTVCGPMDRTTAALSWVAVGCSLTVLIVHPLVVYGVVGNAAAL